MSCAARSSDRNPRPCATSSIRPLSWNIRRPAHAVTERGLTPGSSCSPARRRMSPIAPDTDACALSGEPEPSYATNETPASRVRSRRASWVEPHGDPRLRLSIDPAGVPDAGLRSRLEAEFAKAVEREVLAGPGFALPAHGIARPDTKLDEEWASARNERQKQFVDWGITSERAR